MKLYFYYKLSTKNREMSTSKLEDKYKEKMVYLYPRIFLENVSSKLVSFYRCCSQILEMINYCQNCTLIFIEEIT